MRRLNRFAALFRSPYVKRFKLAYACLALVGLAALAAAPLLYLHGGRRAPARAATCGGARMSWEERPGASTQTLVGLLSLDLSTRRVTTLLTEDMGKLDHPAFSPDGSRLAFLSHSNGILARIQMCDLEKGGTEQLRLPVPGGDFPISWSSDGETLVFVGGDLSGLGADHKPFLVHLESGKLQPLAGEGPWYYNGAVLSPDGRRLALLLQRKELGGEPEQLVVFDADTLEFERITGSWDLAQIEAPTWSPDGNKVAVSAYRRDEDGDLYAVDLKTGEATTLVASPAGERAPAWSPDGKRIAFVRSPAGRPDVSSIWVLDLESGALERMTWGRKDLAPTWSPDGHQLVFVRRG